MSIIRTTAGVIDSDNFNRPDSGTPGGNWNVDGTSMTAAIVSNQMDLSGGGGTPTRPGVKMDGSGLSSVRNFMQVTYGAELIASHNPNICFFSSSVRTGYSIGQNNTIAVLQEWTAGTPANLSTTALASSNNTLYTIQFLSADSLQEAFFTGNAGATVTLSGTDATNNGAAKIPYGIRAAAVSSVNSALFDDWVWTRDDRIFVTGLLSGYKAKVVNSGGTVVAEATESGGTATINCSRFDGVAEFFPFGGWSVLRITTSADVIVEEYNATGVYPGDEYVFAETEIIYLTSKDWPNPRRKGIPNLGFTSFNPSFYTPAADPPQNRQNEWPIPLVAKKIHVGWTDNYVFEDTNIKPIGIGDFIARFPAKKINPDWIQTRPQFYQDDKPFKQDNWPNPALKFKPAITFIHNRKLDEPPTPEPFKPVDFRNPDLTKRIRPDWNQRFSLTEFFTRPIASSAIDLPVLKTKPIALTWINPRPNYYEEPAVIVFKQTSWPNPIVRRGLVGIVNRHFVDAPVTTFPFNQQNWPLPLRKRVAQGWIDNYVIDENLPFVAQVLFVPLSKSNFTPTWISRSPLVINEGTPIVPYDYPNPIIVKQQNKGFIDNLLQSTLDPGEGEKPFNQNDYPNPLIGARNFHSGIIDIRKFYFDEPPLQIGQYDWPVFRSPKRNEVGEIRFVIPGEENKFSTVDFVPIVRLKVGQQWIYTSIYNLTEIVGLKPFNQTDWPIFRRVTRHDYYSFLRSYNNIPPNIIGRLICLDAGLIEYDLEAALEPYDLDARIQIFDLDAGGVDCE